MRKKIKGGKTANESSQSDLRHPSNQIKSNQINQRKRNA